MGGYPLLFSRKRGLVLSRSACHFNRGCVSAEREACQGSGMGAERGETERPAYSPTTAERSSSSSSSIETLREH